MSDIGSFTFKPFFEAGCSVASASFLVGLFRVHSTWHLQTRLSPLASVYSTAALLFGLVGATAWVLQATYDGFRYREFHVLLVQAFCGGVFFSAAFTCLTHHRVTWIEGKSEKLGSQRQHSR